MPDPTLYLFDGYNLIHAGAASDRRELIDRLASFVAVRGARGVVVFDGAGDDVTRGPLEVRFASHADDLIERLAAEHRETDAVCVVSSDRAIRGTAGQEVKRLSSQTFLPELASVGGEAGPATPPPSRIADALDDETRARLERWRREGR